MLLGGVKSTLLSFLSFVILPLCLQSHSRTLRKFALKSAGVKLGSKASILRKVEVFKPSNISIGNNSVINTKVLLDGRGGKVTIGNNVDIAREANIWTLEHEPNSDYHKIKGGDVVIEDYVWVASRATILPGTTIGKGAVVASGALVTKDVQPMTIVAGVPAKVIGQRNSKLLYELDYKPIFQ